MRIKRLFKYFCPLALLIVVTPVILTSCSNVISSLKNYVLNGGIRADVDQTVRTLNTITIYNNNTSYLSLPDDAVLTAITSDLKNNLKISDKDIATRYYYPYPIEKLSATQMKWGAKIYLDTNKYHGPFNYQFTIDGYAFSSTAPMAVHLFPIDNYFMQINGFSNAKFVVMNNYGQFVTSVSDTTCPGTGMSAYTKKLVFGANTDVDAYFNNTNSGVIPYKNGVIVSTSEVIKFTTTGISNGQISLTFDRSNDSNTYAAENNYRLNFDVVVKNGTTYSPTSNLVNRDFNYSRLGDTLFEISDVSNFVYIMENSSSRPRINAVPVFDFSSSIYGNNYTPTNLTDPYLVNALNVSYNSDLANWVALSLVNTYAYYAYALYLSGIKITKLNVKIGSISSKRTKHIGKDDPMYGGNWKLSTSIKNAKFTIFYNSSGTEKIYLDDTINATSTYLGAIAKSPATSVKKVLESDYNNNASISITSDPFTSNTLLPILYLGVISSDGKYISEAKANKTSLVTINRINNNETKSIINKTVLAMIPTKDRIFDSFNNDYNFPINSNLAL